MANLRVPVNFQSPHDASSLLTYLAGSTIDGLCTCAYLQSAIGGIILGVTDWSADLSGVPGYPGVVFKHSSGLNATKLEHPSGTDPSNISVVVSINAAGLTEADIQSGKWDHGAIRIFTTNALDLNMGQMIESDGFFSEFTKSGQVYRTEQRGKLEAFKQVIGKVTAPLCDAVHGDARCGRNLVALGEVHSVALTNVTSQKVFRASSLTQGAGYFDNAEGIFTSGNNNGFPFRVNTWNPATKEFTLRTEAPFLPLVGDTITVKRGCVLTAAACIERANMINFRAFEDIPTLEEFQRLPIV